MRYDVISKNEIKLSLHLISLLLTEKEIRELIKLLTNALFDMNKSKPKEV